METKIVVDIKKGFISYFDLKYSLGDFCLCQEARRGEILAINRRDIVFKGGYSLSIFQFIKLNFHENIPRKNIDFILILK